MRITTTVVIDIVIVSTLVKTDTGHEFGQRKQGAIVWQAHSAVELSHHVTNMFNTRRSRVFQALRQVSPDVHQEGRSFSLTTLNCGPKRVIAMIVYQINVSCVLR
jgi:hypothetical protein